jgi:hypothetical protein
MQAQTLMTLAYTVLSYTDMHDRIHRFEGIYKQIFILTLCMLCYYYCYFFKLQVCWYHCVRATCALQRWQ